MGPQVHAKHRPDFKLLFTPGKKQIWIHVLDIRKQKNWNKPKEKQESGCGRHSNLNLWQGQIITNVHVPDLSTSKVLNNVMNIVLKTKYLKDSW